MTGQMIEFQANGHTTGGYLATPPSGRGPGVIVIQEWWGLVDHIKQVTDRFAREGFVALAPDFYHGEVAKSPDAAGRMLMALDIARAGQDLRGAADALLARPEVTSKTVAAVGFCMGGQLALYGACEHPDKIRAAVDFYGVHPKVEIRPERLVGRVLAHFGKRDKSVTVEVGNALVAKVRGAGKEIEAHFYDADHAFFNDSRPEVYSKESSDLAFSRTTAFLRSELA